jgi:hypothetical protein
MHYETAEPVTAQGPRKGESSLHSVRHGFRTQPANSVRGSSRRIMTMRFRPANIRVINRRVCLWAVTGPAVPKSQGERNLRFLSPLESPFFPQRGSELTSGKRVPAKPPVEAAVDARTVLDVKGSLRRAKQRRALDVSAPFRRDGDRDGRLRREHLTDARKNTRPALLLRRIAGLKTNPSNYEGLDRSLHIRRTTLARPASVVARWRSR